MLDLSLKNWTGLGAEEFMNLSPDADLLAEWESHNRRRTPERHPDQTAHLTQFVDESIVEALDAQA